MKSKEELLRKRYLVIAEDTSGRLKVGEVLECNHLFDKSKIKGFEKHLWNGVYYAIDKKGFQWHPKTLAKYPHLFRELAWYEERDFGDITHIKSKSTGAIIEYQFGKEYNWDNAEPATEEEYNELLKSKP